MIMLIELACVRKLSSIKSNEKKEGTKEECFNEKQKKDLPVDVSKIGVK